MIVLALACQSPPHRPGPSDAAGSGETEDTGLPGRDTGGPGEVASCRSLDPDWILRFTDPLDQELAALIAREGLEGDPALSVDEQGVCRRRPLPSVDSPMAKLGRSLFFSKDLSGDLDVACASCHHPLLGGGDAIALSVGPTDRPDAMGADRVRGLTDPASIFVPRNAPTTFNVAFWDAGLFWDSRVAALEESVHGRGVPIHTPDAAALDQPAAEAGEDLSSAQAWFPVTETHEMAGSWGSLGREQIRADLAARLAADPRWVQRFREVCGSAGLPASWAEACESGADPVTFPHLAHAIGVYEQSQVFTESPWSAYVQGDPTALTPGAKQGALLFFRSVAEGGQNCVACHRGDFFTDEAFHAIGGPQIGPGKADGTDAGRQLLTGEVADEARFRTATLLNVEVTAPFGHAGAYPTLAKAIGHYDNPNGRLFEYFGEANKSDLNTRPWCAMVEFASIPGCETLYRIEDTAHGRVADVLDPELTGIKTLENQAAAYLEEFLRSLTDPRVRDSLALGPWIDPDSTLQVTETSSEWGSYCDTMVERAADMNLHNKGLRWVATGAVVDGQDVNARVLFDDLFGVHYWEIFDTAFLANTGLDQDDRQLGMAVLAALEPAQQDALFAGFADLTARDHDARIRALRLEVFDRMNTLRLGGSVPASELDTRMVEAWRLEGEDLISIRQIYADLDAAVPPATRDAQTDRFRALARGDLGSLPAGMFTPGDDSLVLPADLAASVRELGRGDHEYSWDAFVAGYLTWRLGSPCRFAFMGRQADTDRHANLFGFPLWASNYLFDLNTGKVGSGDFELEMSGYLDRKDTEYGLSALFQDTLDESLRLRADHDRARRALVDGLVAQDPEAVRDASEAVGRADAAMLGAELAYYVALALADRGQGDLAAYVACIESPATQAMKGQGGFDALGGGTCEPR